MIAVPAVLIALVFAGPQPAAPALPAAPQAVAVEPNVWLVIYNVRPDRAPAFEEVARQVREAMRRSNSELRRRQSTGLRLYRSALPNPEGNTVYFLHVPEFTGGDDDRTGFDVLIDAVLPEQATALKARLDEALDPRNPSGNTLMLAVP
jgi:hypothetical protein